jgi:hypothetical protein
MDKKTSWEHVLGEPVVHAPGERPMKASIDARFDGTFKEFVAWMEATFKNKDDLRVRANIGEFARDIVMAAPDVERVFPEPVHRLVAITQGRLSLQDANRIAYTASKTMSENRDNKVPAIKKVREDTGLGLKDAKDFVEYLQEHPLPEEEIPF